MKKLSLSTLLLLVLLSACVPAKKFEDLENRFNQLQKNNKKLNDQLADCEQQQQQTSTELSSTEEQLQQLKAEKDQLQKDYNQLDAKQKNLQQSYDALEKNSSSALAENSQRNRQLLAELEEKEKALAAEKTRLEKLEKDLEARSRRVNELEGMIAAKDAKMQALKNSLSKALTDFEGKGLTVEQRNGKVYVSMENKLLFASGSWAVGSQGKKAVSQLASVLAENDDINVLIEGHTDNVPYGGNGPLKNNWDLSTKRATAIVELLLMNNGISPERLTAAGRGEHLPVATNETTDGKAKNRRIEVILTPKLDEVNQLLNEM